MSHHNVAKKHDAAAVHELLSGSGYSDKAIEYYFNQPNMGSVPDANQVTDMTGTCGDTMRVYLKVDRGRIKTAKALALGCPGLVAATMVAMELVEGKTIKQAQRITDLDILRILEPLPDEKKHCIRLAVQALQKTIDAYGRDTKRQGSKREGE